MVSDFNAMNTLRYRGIVAVTSISYAVEKDTLRRDFNLKKREDENPFSKYRHLLQSQDKNKSCQMLSTRGWWVVWCGMT